MYLSCLLWTSLLMLMLILNAFSTFISRIKINYASYFIATIIQIYLFLPYCTQMEKHLSNKEITRTRVSFTQTWVIFQLPYRSYWYQAGYLIDCKRFKQNNSYRLWCTKVYLIGLPVQLNFTDKLERVLVCSGIFSTKLKLTGVTLQVQPTTYS